MQVTERAANEWVHEKQDRRFQSGSTFEPKTNLEAGTWYLHRAMEHWTHQSDPIPFALAEYNAGASRAIAGAVEWPCRDTGTPVSSKDRFPGNAQIRRVDYRPLQILSAPWADVTRNSVQMIRVDACPVFSTCE